MITIHEIDENYLFIENVKALYRKSFPKNERDPFNHLINNNKEHKFVAFEENSKFIGFAYFICYKNITHILYLSINPSIRNKGYGSKVLNLIHLWQSNSKIIIDAEVDDSDSINLKQRIQRLHFYEKNGYKKTDITYFWNGVHYELLCFNKMITVKEFDEFWHHFINDEDMGKFLYETFKTK